jgi:hypothetical protein
VQTTVHGDPSLLASKAPLIGADKGGLSRVASMQDYQRRVRSNVGSLTGDEARASLLQADRHWRVDRRWVAATARQMSPTAVAPGCPP